MLFDPNKAIQQPTFAGFIAFCESKDPNEHYEWSSYSDCACAQYAKSIGFENWTKHAHDGELWDQLNNIAAMVPTAWNIEDMRRNWTFGELVKRLRAAAT
jgi:hypothetical protein